MSSGYIAVLFAAFSFGIYPPTTKLAYAAGANPSLLILVSTTLRTLALLVAALRKGYSLKDIFQDSQNSIGPGSLQALTIVGITTSLRFIPGPVMITIIFSHTLLLLLFLVYRGQEKLSLLNSTTSLVALTGIGLVVDVFSTTTHVDPRGLVLAGIAAFATASRMYVYGNQVKAIPPEIVGVRAFSVASLLLLSVLAWESPQLPTSIHGFLWLGVACISLVAGTILTFLGLASIGSFRTSLMLKIEPVCTCGYSLLLLNEALNPSQYLGIALVLGSLGAYQFFDTQKKRVHQS